MSNRETMSSLASNPLSETKCIIGQLESNGLHIDTNIPSSAIHSEIRLPEEILGQTSSYNTSTDSDATSTTSSEDYDKLEIEPDTVVAGGKGGGFDHETLVDNDSVEQSEGSKSYQEIKAGRRSTKRPGAPMRLQSIPVTLQTSQKDGRYLLVADNSEVRKILKMTTERSDRLVKTKRRSKFSDLIFTRQFTAFDRQNTASTESPFHGFFTLVWIGVTIFIIQTCWRNYKAYGNIMGTNEIMNTMMHRDLLVLGISDGILYATTGFGWVLQVLIHRGWLTWHGAGYIIQSVWELFYISFVVYWTLFREWPWTHTVFFVMHGIIMLMKQHSYAFYNGHLSEAYRSRQSLLKRLKQLEDVQPAQTPGPMTPAVTSFMTSYLDDKPGSSEMTQRDKVHRNEVQRNQTELSDPQTGIAQITAAIESGQDLDLEQVQLFEKIMKWEIDALQEELKGKTTVPNASYPHNLTFVNHYAWVVLPTVTYELEYPRSERINWYNVAEKALATVGILFVMMLVSQSYIYPQVMLCVAMKEAQLPLWDRLLQFPGIYSDLIFPFMLEYLMAWYVIWECILNLLAELTRFADRGFYADWWNSVSWDQFARDWNRPVHVFLLRHVYQSSISSFKIGKGAATLITFAISAVVHELVMWCIFKKLRGYLLVFQMMQLPLVQLSRSRFLKGHATLGNIMFWIGIFTGPSLLCSLYLII